MPNTPRATDAQGASIIRFPARNAAAIFISEAAEGGWLVLALGHGWLHGDRRAALRDAHWLAWNTGLPIRRGARA